MSGVERHTDAVPAAFLIERPDPSGYDRSHFPAVDEDGDERPDRGGRDG